jgi:hypothetical protein
MIDVELAQAKNFPSPHSRRDGQRNDLAQAIGANLKQLPQFLRLKVWPNIFACSTRSSSAARICLACVMFCASVLRARRRPWASVQLIHQPSRSAR